MTKNYLMYILHYITYLIDRRNGAPPPLSFFFFLFFSPFLSFSLVTDRVNGLVSTGLLLDIVYYWVICVHPFTYLLYIFFIHFILGECMCLNMCLCGRIHIHFFPFFLFSFSPTFFLFVYVFSSILYVCGCACVCL